MREEPHSPALANPAIEPVANYKKERSTWKGIQTTQTFDLRQKRFLARTCRPMLDRGATRTEGPPPFPWGGESIVTETFNHPKSLLHFLFLFFFSKHFFFLLYLKKLTVSLLA